MKPTERCVLNISPTHPFQRKPKLTVRAEYVFNSIDAVKQLVFIVTKIEIKISFF